MFDIYLAISTIRWSYYMKISTLNCVENAPSYKIQNATSFESRYGSPAYKIEQRLAQKGIESEFLDNLLVADCTRKTVAIFEKIFGKRLLSKSIKFTPINPYAYGDCSWSDSAIRINSRLECFDSKEKLSEEMKKSKNIFFLPDEKSTTHYLGAFIHELAHSVHFNHLKETHLGFMISRFHEARIPNAIGRLITKYKLGKYSAENMNEFMAERITKDIARNLNSKDEFVGSTLDLKYSDIFKRKWNCRYICPQAYIDYYTQQVWAGDINGAEAIAKKIEQYLLAVEKAENPQEVKLPVIETTLKTIERPQEEARIKRDNVLGYIDAFFGAIVPPPVTKLVDKLNDVKIKLER